MATIFELGNPPSRFARLRFGSSAREALSTFRGGRPLSQPSCSLSARVYVKDGTSPPLGDCPRSTQVIVFSSRACEALSEFLTEFELVRVEFHGLGIEK